MPHCTKCGAMVSESSAYCPQCGQPQPGTPRAQPPAGAAAQTGLSENAAGLLCYALGWITGLIFLVIDKRPYVRFHAAQSLVLFGGLHVLRAVLGMAFGVGWLFGGWHLLGVGIMGGLLFGALGLLVLVLWIVCMVKAYQGERFRVPIAADLAESFFGKQ